MRRKFLFIALLSSQTIAYAKDVPAVAIGDGPGLTYRLPKANIKLTADLILRKCDAGGEFLADSTIALTSTAGADMSKAYRLSAQGLMSGTQKRDLTLELNENATVKSLNSVSEDRTGGIVVGVFKAAAQIAGAFFGFGTPMTAVSAGTARYKCNKATTDALRQVQDLEAATSDQRDVLMDPNSTAVEVKAAGKRINLLAAQLASIEQGALKISLSTSLDPEKAYNQNAPVEWTMGDLRQWFAREPNDTRCVPFNRETLKNGAAAGPDFCEEKAAAFALTYQFAGEKAPDAARKIADTCLFKAADNSAKGCERHLAIVIPATAVVSIKAVGNDFGGIAPGGDVATMRTQMPQWGATALVPVAVKTAQSRTLELGFDGFGGVNHFKWSSAATAENATATVGSLVEAALPVIKAVKGDSDLEEKKKRIEAIETQQKLEDLEKCQTIRKAGGTCPAAEEAE